MKDSSKPTLDEVIELMNKITEDANTKLIEFRAMYGLSEYECGFISKENGKVGMYLNMDKLRS